MSLLDDPALNIRSRAGAPARSVVLVRFLPTSRFAAVFDIPLDSELEVRSRYMLDGQERLNVHVIGGVYATGVPADEVTPIERRRDQPDAV